MSFVFTPAHTFEWPVTILMPSEGAHTEITITGLFEIADDAEFVSPGDGITSTGDAIDFEIERICSVFKGWKAGDITLENGTEVEVTDENIRKLLGIRPVRLAVLAAYSDAITPTAGYRAKN